MAKVWTKGTIALTVVLVILSVSDAGSIATSRVEFYTAVLASIAYPIILVAVLRVAYLKVRGRVGTLRSPTN